MGFFSKLFGKAEATPPAQPLVGLWEQVGMLNPKTGEQVAWPKGSPNASVREFLWLFEDGMLKFGRFLADAKVEFDAAGRRFVCEKGVDKLVTGTWCLEQGTLYETFGGQQQPVHLGEITKKRFIVEEKTPIPNFVLKVVYERREPPPAPAKAAAPAPAGGEKLFEVPCVIDRALWSRAECLGVAFLAPQGAPPGLGLILGNAEAAAAIFDGWRKQLGPSDEKEMIRVAIIEGEIAGKGPGYTLTIGPDMDSLKQVLRSDPSLGGVSVDPTKLDGWIRRMDTAPGGSPHLKVFKDLFAVSRVYALVPVLKKNGEFEPDYGRQIVKHKLLLRDAKDIGPGDPDRQAVG